MALDTRDRRASALAVGLPWRGLLPLPDGDAEDQGDRQQVGGYYRGILAGLPVFVPVVPLILFSPAVRVATGLGAVARLTIGWGAVTHVPSGFSSAEREA